METLCLWWVYMLLLLVQYPTGFSLLNNNSSMNHLCHEDESQLLLQLKQHLSPLYPGEYYKTKYWKESGDCCLWDGVTCDYFTGHVIALDLSSSNLIGKLNSSSSLFHLTHLRSLNLAFNNFSGSAIPSEFGRLNALTHLNLSFADFEGELPMEFYHLSNLLSLDLSTFDIFDRLKLINIRCDVKMLFGNMTTLRELLLTNQDLSSSELPVNMSSFLTYLDLGHAGLRGNLPATVFEKPNLQFLNLGGNSDLKGSLPRNLNSSNVHSIMALDLGSTSVSGRLSDSVGLMSNLYYMGFSNCRLWGPVPESVGNLTGIESLDLSVNELSGGLPSTFSNLRNLFYLDLSINHLEGQLPDAVWGFQNLYYLNLYSNYVEGQIPSSLTNMSQLIHFDISSNAFSGPFPSTEGHGLHKLRTMYLNNNSIQGTIPPWLFTLPSLKRLGLSSNKLTGRIGKLNSGILILWLSYNRFNLELETFYNLTNIQFLVISHNKVIVHDGNNVNVTFPNLEILDMSSCEIKELPYNFLRSMPNLNKLDLSNNNIHGPIPSLLTSNSSQPLTYLNLSFNFLTYAGDLPWQGLQYIDLQSNLLRGTFPSSIYNMSQLFLINLSHNKLSGNIPECLSNSSTQLGVFDVRRNEFRGKIPKFGIALYELSYIGLNGNLLEGPLPPSLANCTGLEVIDLGNNMIQDTFPWWLHTLTRLTILILKSNAFHGSLTSHFTGYSFGNLQILDLSHNNFTGLLPEKLFERLQAIKNQSQASPFIELYMSDFITRYQYSVSLSVKGKEVDFTKVFRVFTTIDLSCNNFDGSIPLSLSNLTALHLLNLSHNNIHGSIPPALGRMTNLEQLDLSNNQLTADIPQTLTNLTFLEALDLSHNHLVGPIPVANQFLTFSNESYVGNSGLCGAPLTRICGDEREPPSAGEFEEEDEEEEGFMMGFTWKAVVMGYGCGIVLGFILGSIMLSMEKPKWLARFVYVEAAIILSKQNKRRRVVRRRR